MSKPTTLPRGIHRLATFLAGYVVLLITAGGLVKSLEAGLSVPDWPLSYGMLNPPRWWEIETVRAEHGHRLIAGVALILTAALTIWIARREERPWVRKLAYLAMGAVLAQAALGGITVLFYLPTAISVSHAGLAQAFLVMVVTLAVVTSRFWLEAGTPAAGVEAAGVVTLATATTVLIYLQILVGAVMRHIGAGLAIPDFPLVFGGLIPPKMDFAIAIHYTHRVGALLVATLVFWTLGRVLRLAARQPALTRPAIAMAVLVLVQGTLGGLVVWTSKAVWPNTLHVGTGALLIAASMVLTLACRRLSWLAERRPVRAESTPVEMLGAEQATT